MLPQASHMRPTPSQIPLDVYESTPDAYESDSSLYESDPDAHESDPDAYTCDPKPRRPWVNAQ